MAGMTCTFRGQCLSSALSQKGAFSRFMTQPDGQSKPVEFEVSCPDAVAPEDLWKLADWTILNLRPVVFNKKDGSGRGAFFAADKITGVKIK